MSAARPELVAPPEIFYNEEEARKYTSNSHMIETQVRRRCGCGRLGARDGSGRSLAAALVAAPDPRAPPARPRRSG